MVFDTGAMILPTLHRRHRLARQRRAIPRPTRPRRRRRRYRSPAPMHHDHFIIARHRRRQPRHRLRSRHRRPWPKSLDAPFWISIVAAALVLLNIGLPVFSLFASLRERFSVPYMWTEFGPQVQGAMIVAAIAATVATIAAISAAGKWTPGLIALAGATFLVGGQLLAIALIRIYNRPWLDWAYNAFPVPVIAYVGRFGWLSLAAGRGTWTRPWKELRDMSSIDGASTFRTALSIIWPLAWPTLLAGASSSAHSPSPKSRHRVIIPPESPGPDPHAHDLGPHARFDPMIQASLLMMIAVLVPALLALALFWIASHGKRKMLGRISYRRDAETQRRELR